MHTSSVVVFLFLERKENSIVDVECCDDQQVIISKERLNKWYLEQERRLNDSSNRPNDCAA
jgi:hypothetical protein